MESWKTILSWRLRWYVLETSRALLRHWQALALCVMLLLPTMPVFAQSRLLGAPVLAALAPSHGLEWRFVWVHLLEAGGVLWVLMQRTAITGGRFATYFKSLPVSNGRRRGVDAFVVLIANTPLFLPVIAAAIALAFSPQKASNYLFVLGLTLTTLGWQLTVLSRGLRNASLLVVANVMLIGGLQTDHAIRPALFAIALVLATFAVVHTPAASPSQSVRLGRLSCLVTAFVRDRVRLGISPVAKLQLRIVWHFAAGVVSRYLMMGAIAAFACFFVHLWDFDVRVVPLTLIAQAMIALVAAATYRDLRAAHLRAAHFMRSLPLARAAQARADMLTVAVLALPFACVAPGMLVVHGIVPLWKGAAIVLTGAPLLALLRLPQRYAARVSVLLGAMASAAWTAIAWQLFV